MVTKKIYLVRHGQTDYNLKGVVQGSGIDAPLNDTGRRQAKAFFDFYKAIPFDKIYYSGLIRTRQSIQSFIDLNIPSESIAELNEISWGIFEGLPMTHDENKYYNHMLEQWAEGSLDYAIEGGESPYIVVKRLEIGIKHILSQDGDNILICMHGRAMRILLCFLLGYDLRYMNVFSHHNLGLYLLHQSDPGKFTIKKYNSADHFRILKELI